MNFKEFHPQFFLISFKIFKSWCERWMKKKKLNRSKIRTHIPLDWSPLPYPLNYQLIYIYWVAKTYLKGNFIFCRFLRGLTSSILRFFQKIMLNHVPTFSTCWIFSMCLLYDNLGPSIKSIQFLGVILDSSLPYLQFFSYTKYS